MFVHFRGNPTPCFLRQGPTLPQTCHEVAG